MFQRLEEEAQNVLKVLRFETRCGGDDEKLGACALLRRGWPTISASRGHAVPAASAGLCGLCSACGAACGGEPSPGADLTVRCGALRCGWQGLAAYRSRTSCRSRSSGSDSHPLPPAPPFSLPLFFPSPFVLVQFQPSAMAIPCLLGYLAARDARIPSARRQTRPPRARTRSCRPTCTAAISSQ